MKNMYAEIPLEAGRVQGWKDIPITASQPDPLVPLGPLSGEAAILTTSSIYFGEHSNSPYAEDKHTLQGSLLTLFARRSVAHRLLAAERLLPAGYHLLLFDAYRPYQVQKSLYDFYKQRLSEKYPDMGDGALDAETQKYVSLPSVDPARPSPHNTGGAVDVAIIKGAKMLDFGTAFDHGGEKSALAYYESKIAMGALLTSKDMRACRNRRLLFKVMTQAGFAPYFAEWWHFNAPETQMGAAAIGLHNATFGATALTASNLAHEKARLAVHRKSGSKLAAQWPAEIIAPE